MKNFIKKYKFTIIINLFIAISYICISSTPNLFGIDDISANIRIYKPNLTLMQTISYIKNRALNWNCRIGEILYFIIGCFPRWVYFIVDGLLIITFFNLIYIFTFGKKSKSLFNSKKYYLTMLINYLITLIFFPAFSETMIWMAGVFNHLFDTIIVLIAAIPLRLLFDNYDIFKHHKKLKYFYFIFLLIAGFSTENIVPWLILYIFITIIYCFKTKKSTTWTIPALCIVTIAFIIFTLLASTNIRIEFFSSKEWTQSSKKYIILKTLARYIYIELILLILFIVHRIEKGKKFFSKDLKFILIQLIISFVSILVLYLSSYYVIRATLLFYFFLLTVITYFTYNIKLNNIPILNVLITICILFATNNLVFFYNDFNDFNNYRYKYILSQKTNSVICPNYVNSYNYFYSYRLKSYEDLYCDITYIREITNNKKIKTITRKSEEKSKTLKDQIINMLIK